MRHWRELRHKAQLKKKKKLQLKMKKKKKKKHPTVLL